MASTFSSNEQQAIDREVDEISSETTSRNRLDSVYELNRCAAWLNAMQVSKVCLQFPDSLLNDSVAVSEWLQDFTGKSIYVLGDTSYGSCCIDLVAAKHVPAEALIHFGPACLSNSSANSYISTIPVLYVFPRCHSEDVRALVDSITMTVSSAENILLISSCECCHLQDGVCEALKVGLPSVVSSRLMTGEAGPHSCLCSQGLCSSHCSNTSTSGSAEHQIVCLGRGFCLPQGVGLENCDIVYIGAENAFLHSLLLSLAIKSNSCNCFSPQGSKFLPALDTVKLSRRQLFLAQQVREATVVALVLANPGDPSLLPAVRHARSLLAARRPPPKVYSLAVGKPNPAKLANFQEVEVFVLLACPLHPLLAATCSQSLSKDFYRTIVGLAEVELALNSVRTSCGPDYKDIIPGGCDYIPLKQNLSELAEADVSLLTGRLLRLSNSPVDEEDGAQALAERSSCWEVTELAGAKFLAGRSWQGLDPALGAHFPSLARLGRSGIAAEYSSEPQIEKS